MPDDTKRALYIVPISDAREPCFHRFVCAAFCLFEVYPPHPTAAHPAEVGWQRRLRLWLRLEVQMMPLSDTRCGDDAARTDQPYDAQRAFSAFGSRGLCPLTNNPGYRRAEKPFIQEPQPPGIPSAAP